MYVFNSQILYDIFFKASSGNDIGTMCANMNVINNCNAKTNNVLDNFNQCKDYVNLETDALITAAALTYFGMSSLDDKVDSVIPPDILKSSKEKRRLWLHGHVKQMLSKFVMSDQTSEHEHIREHVAEANRPKVYVCRVCGKQYKYPKARENHENRVHPESIQTEDNDTPPQDGANADGDSEPTEKPRDDRYQYATLHLSMGFLLRNFDDAVKEGDGKRIICCWKFAMLIYRAFNHNKYALAALHLQADIMAMLTPREAESLVWNRTVNTKGGAGKNISMDLRMEHLINLIKELLKHLGPNITESAATHCSKSVGHVDRLLDAVDEDLLVESPGGHHKVQKREPDFRLLVDEIHQKGRMFKFAPESERRYHVCGNFRDSLIKGLDLGKLNKWISEKTKELHKMESL